MSVNQIITIDNFLARLKSAQIVLLYEYYNGLEVSIDDDKKDWIKAIKKDNITWKQVNIAGGWNSHIAVKWRIEAIPTSYLIDKEGKLVAMDLEGKELEETLKYMLGK